MLSVRGGSPFDHNPNHNHSTPTMALEQQARTGRKRKAESQDNERLSKRLSCLNIAGQNLRKLYATVEDAPRPIPPAAQPAADEHMQVDDSKHKVYIYNLDDELSSSDSDPDDGRLVFLPDIERALRANRIPPVVRANGDGQLAGRSLEDMQVVLYNVPSSLSVAPEHDSVRKAIIEARARARQGRGPVALMPAPAMESRAATGEQVAMGGSAGGMQTESIPEDVDAMDLS